MSWARQFYGRIMCTVCSHRRIDTQAGLEQYVSPLTHIHASYIYIYIYVFISSVYSPFSDRVGLRLHNISIGAEFLRPDALPGVNHMRWIQSQIVLNITSGQNSSCTNLCTQFLHKTTTLIYALNRPLVASYDIPGYMQ